MTPEESQLHQRHILQTRRKSLLQWVGVAAFILCQGAATFVALPALQQAKLTWVTALLAVAGVLCIGLVGSLGRAQKLLWPATFSDWKATARGPSRAASKR